MLTEKDAIELVEGYGARVNEGRTIQQIILDGDLPRLKDTTVQKGKVSDSVFGEELVTRLGIPIRLMYRSNRISTHDENRGEIPFKDQVLALNHDFMLNLLKDVLGSSQFEIPGLDASSTVIPAENLKLFKLENVLRMYMADSSTETSLAYYWKKRKDKSKKFIKFAGHKLNLEDLKLNGKLPYLLDTPSTKAEVDQTVSPQYLFDNKICTPGQYAKIRNRNMMAFGIVTQYARTKGMVVADTKEEEGINHLGQIVAGDELYTMDSSRYWKLNDDGSIMYRDGKPVSFSKEFARGMVKEKGQIFTQEQATEIAVRYILGYQYLMGKEFKPDLRPRDERLIETTNLILDHLL